MSWGTVTVIIAAAWLSSVRGATRSVILTANETAKYDESNPLVVNISDTVVFRCNGSVSNVIILASQQQWQTCNTTTGGAPFQAGYCVTRDWSLTIEITYQSAPVAGTYSFNQGQDYYIASFSDGTELGAVNNKNSGGECLQGVKMVMRVQGRPTTTSPPTSSSTSTSSVVVPTNSTDATHPTSQPSSSGSDSSPSRSQQQELNSLSVEASPITALMLPFCAIVIGLMRR